MSKNLYLVRHAKAEKEVFGQRDFDRQLNSVGLTDAPRMGLTINLLQAKPQLIITSPAARTLETAELIAEQLSYDKDQIQQIPDLYNSSVRILMGVLNQLEENFEEVMIVGHNPGITYFAEYLTHHNIGDIPTCGIVKIDFNELKWNVISEGSGTFMWSKYPE